MLACLKDTEVSQSLIVDESGLDRDVVRRTLHRLARQGKVVGRKLVGYQRWRHGGTRRVSCWWWRLKTRRELIDHIFKNLPPEQQELIAQEDRA